MYRISRYLFLILILSSVIYMSCKDDSVSSSSNGCDQNCKDQNTAYGVAHVFYFIWNQNIAGSPSGTKDFTVNGPQGGSIHVTGSTGYSSGINTCHLVFDMTDCKGLDEHYSLTFNGVVSIDGTFSSGYKALGFTSPSLKFQGTVGKDANAPVNETCAISINETTDHMSGTICGREFSYK